MTPTHAQEHFETLLGVFECGSRERDHGHTAVSLQVCNKLNFLRHEFLHRTALPRTHFEHQNARRGQVRRRFMHKPLDHVEASITGKQRQRGLIACHIIGQVGVTLDVGRITENDIVGGVLRLLLDKTQEVTLDKTYRRPESICVRAR